MNQKKLIFVLLGIIVVLIATVFYLLGVKQAQAPGNNGNGNSQAKPNQTRSDSENQKTNPQANPQAKQPVNQQEKVAVAGTVYQNQDFGFRITFPAGWEKYKAMVEKDLGSKGLSYIHILLPTTDKNWPAEENRVTKEKISGFASIFAISVWEKALWEKEKNSPDCQDEPMPGCPFESTVINKSDKYVFTVSLAQAYPEDPAIKKLVLGLEKGSVDNVAFQAQFKKMFELIK